MNIITTSWSCQRCGATCISAPPEHGLCDQCLDDLQALAHDLPETVACPACGGPVCPDCGTAMITVLVPATTPASATEQAAQLIAGYRQHRREVGGDDT
jgi:hypothetical protein